jgi:hypothetical protein
MEVSAFVEAEDEASALEVGVSALREEADNGFGEDILVSEVTHRNWPRDPAWSDSSLVYGAPHSTTLGVWLSKLPPRVRKP